MAKKVLVILGVAAALIAGAVSLYLIPRNATIVTSTSGFLSSSYHFNDANPILKMRVPFSSVNEDRINEIKEANRKSLEEAFQKVTEVDGKAFRDDYTSIESCVFELGDYFYYFRTDDTKNVYKVNPAKSEMIQCPLSGYNGFTNSGLRDRYTEVDHNFTTFVSIRTEALIDAYPGLRNAIDSVDGLFYHTCLFYDNGRIFFEKKSTIYEYIPDTDKVVKIASVGSGETVEYVLDR